jgi:hypothetical protein
MAESQMISEDRHDLSASVSTVGDAEHTSARRTVRWLIAVVVVFCALGTGLVFTKRPWCDEGWFADITYNLVRHGAMFQTVLDPHGFIFSPYVKAIDRYTYWVLPNYILSQAAWCSLAGFSLQSFRMTSVFWGSVAICSWYFVVARLTCNATVAVVAAAVLALDQNFVTAASTGRMDMMCAALNLTAAALYLRLRSRFHVAVFTSCCVLAVALLTHPNAVFGAILLMLIVLAYDRERICWRTIGIAAVPFLVAVGAWGLYVLRAPDIFMEQMRAQSRIPHRFSFTWNLFRQFTYELNTRFGRAYKLHWGSIVGQATGAIVFLYFGATIALVAMRPLRSRPGSKLIFSTALLSFTLLSCFQDNWYYLVYILPSLAAAMAICLVWLWERRSRATRIVIIGAAMAVLGNVSVVGYRILHDDYRGRYVKVIQFLSSHARPNDLVMGSGELAFDLGFEGRVVDDCRLGFYTGKRPQFIVMEHQYYAMWIPTLSVYERQVSRYISKLLGDDYKIVYDQKLEPYRSRGLSDMPYVVYQRKSAK